jgi:alpha-2-macroglobulin
MTRPDEESIYSTIHASVFPACFQHRVEAFLMRPRFYLVLFAIGSLLGGQTLTAQSGRTGSAGGQRGAPAGTARAGGPAKAGTTGSGKRAAPRAGPAGDLLIGDLLLAGDRSYSQKSYKSALRAYQDALKQDQVPAGRRPQVEYRVARCMGLTGQWDAALVEGARVANRHAGGVWEARTRAWVTELYLRVPHEGWKVGERIFRGESVPETEAEARPERVDLTAEDYQQALLNGEQAKSLYEKVRKERPGTSEEANHAADLARVVALVQMDSWARRLEWKEPADRAWKLEPQAAYDPGWAPPRKVLQLYLNAEALGTPEQKPLARLSQALWLRGYHQMMGRVAWREGRGGERKRVPYPYQSRDALDVLKSLIKDFPAHPESDHARLTVADWLAQDEEFAGALSAYKALLKEQPQSKWAAAARTAAAAITRLELRLDSPEPQPPGKKAVLRVDARNVPTVKFSAHRVKLEALVKDPRVVAQAREGINDLFSRVGKLKGIRKFYQGDPVTWEAALAAKKEHAPYSDSVETPLTENGAYVVEADGGAVRAAALVVVSDLAALQIVDQDRVHAMVVEARSGAPVAEASALIREVYEDAQEKQRVSAATVTTDANGLAEKPLAPSRRFSQDVLTFAWKGDRYAFTGSAWRQGPGPGPDTTRAYVYTERPVYRPSQTVHYRALLAARGEDAAWKPLPGQKVRVRIQDPKGAYVDTQDLVAGDYGSVSGDVGLDPGAPLGEYRISVSWAVEKQMAERGTGSFRVEEYKRPEFEVTVAPPGPPNSGGGGRVGDPMTARIAARYYFGAPVQNARVQYTVVRSEWIPDSPFRGPYDSLYSSRTGESHPEPWGGEWVPIPEEEVLSGTATTDAGGEAVIRFPTDPKDPRLRGRHLRFTVHAEVTDASRRTIEGAGEVRALASQFNAFLNVRQGFYAVGDRLQADIRTLDASGRPVSVTGTARVLRLTVQGGRTVSEEVRRQPLKTDDQGRATFDWVAARDGSYEVRFEARDAWEQWVVGRGRAWIAGDGAGAGVFHNRHVLIIPERTTYRIGETARVLLVADEPGSTALLTYEAGSGILEKKVVQITGRSMVLEIPLTRRASPDVVLAVTGVRDRELFRSETTLYVPPAEQLLNVEVSADKSRYRPGEKATFRLRARDVEGKPVRTECSVGIIDASVFYIQGDQTPAIGAFFYAEERGSDLSAQESLSQAFAATGEDDQPPLKWERQEWKFPDGLGTPALVELTGGDLLAGDDVVFVPHAVPATGYPAVRAPQASVAKPRAQAPLESAPAMPPAAAEAGTPATAVRKNFADTALWTPAVVTGENGEATVRVTWPDNLTQWRASVRGWSESAQVGEATADVETFKELLVRLQAPRFFVERDELVLSANVHNYTDQDRRIRVTLQMEGETLSPASAGSTGPAAPRRIHVPRADRSDQPGTPTSPAGGDPSLVQWIDLPKGSEKRVDWNVRVERPGEARIRVLADAGSESDAMELTFPVYVHGVEKLIVKSGAMLMAASEKPGSRSAKMTLDLPEERAPDSGELIVQVSPSTAAAMLDALPYLVDYPYGCVEQTMSRFLPAAVCAKTLTDLGLNLDDLRKRAELEYARRKEDAPLARPEASGYTYPEGSPGRKHVERLAREVWRWRAERSPVYNPDLLQKMAGEGLARLRRFQNADGGWGWWQNDGSDGRMTAYVLQGLAAGKAAGLPIPASMTDRGFLFLEKRFARTTDLHDAAYLGWVLTMDGKRAEVAGKGLLERVYPKRDGLMAYGTALLALALKQSGRNAEARVCMENLENTAQIDKESGTCSWTKDAGAWWGWQNNDVETAAMCLRVYNALEPKHRLAPMVVRWLCNNRSGSAWNSTRETAMAVQALAEYVKANGELAPEYTVTVDVNGQFKRTFTVNAENALLFDNRMVVPAPALGHGPQTVTLTREGKGNLYYSATLRYFTLEEGVQAAGNEIRVRRRYFRLTKPSPGTAAKGSQPLTGDGYARTLVRAGDTLSSGDLLEVELLLESKNSYDYLVFEDMKPAGCEPVELRSGVRYGDGLCSNMELRDEKVAFFVTSLPQGKRMITYRLRAEIPGYFHALPLNGYAMYAPDVRCISDEGNLGIADSSSNEATR